MGGSGSGPRRRYVGTIGQVPRLDVRALARRGALAPGTAWAMHGELELTLRVESGGVLVMAVGGALTAGVFLRVERTPCRFGGERPWWRCPACGRRCAVLFWRGVFLCRQCARLTYPSRRQDASGRAWLRQVKAWRRLGHNDPHDTPSLRELPFAKPKGMHWRTFSRLAATIEQAEEIRMAALIRAAARFGPLGAINDKTTDV